MQTSGLIQPDLLVLKVLFSGKIFWRYQFWVICNRHVTILIDEDNELRLNFLGLQTRRTCTQLALVGRECQELAFYAISILGCFTPQQE